MSVIETPRGTYTVKNGKLVPISEREIRFQAYSALETVSEMRRADAFYERIKDKPEEVITRYSDYLKSTHSKSKLIEMLSESLSFFFNRKSREVAVSRYQMIHMQERQEQRMEEARKILERGEADVVCG